MSRGVRAAAQDALTPRKQGQGLIARHSGIHLSAQQVKQLKSGDQKAYLSYPANLEAARILHRQMAQLSKTIDQVEKLG